MYLLRFQYLFLLLLFIFTTAYKYSFRHFSSSIAIFYINLFNFHFVECNFYVFEKKKHFLITIAIGMIQKPKLRL